jgi:hypothetical protein
MKINKKHDKKPTRVKRELTMAIKKEIVSHYQTMKARNPRYTQLDLITDFSSVVGYKIPTTTISGILHLKESILESDQYDGYRNRKPKYPQLEESLFAWYEQARADNSAINDQILIKKAEELGTMLKIDNFSYSTGWLVKFKSRYGIKEANLSKLAYETNVRMLSVQEFADVNSFVANEGEMSNEMFDMVGLLPTKEEEQESGQDESNKAAEEEEEEEIKFSSSAEAERCMNYLFTYLDINNSFKNAAVSSAFDTIKDELSSIKNRNVT